MITNFNKYKLDNLAMGIVQESRQLPEKDRPIFFKSLETIFNYSVTDNSYVMDMKEKQYLYLTIEEIKQRAGKVTKFTSYQL